MMQAHTNGNVSPDMTSARPSNATKGPTVYYINVRCELYQKLLERAPHINVKFIKTIKPFADAPDVADLGDLDEIEIVFAGEAVFSKLIADGVHFANLKWFHTVTAGVEHLLETFKTNQMSPHYVITRSPASCDNVSEFVIAQILAHRRLLYQYYDQQRAGVWLRSIGPSQMSLSQFSVVLLGVGQIGQRTAKLLNAFGMTVYGVTRSRVEKGHGSPDVHHYRTTEELPSTLSEVDFIVNILPSTPVTRGLLDNDVLRVCQKKKPVFLNVGRGDVISEDSIIKALRSGWISRAVLDVFPVEPLPPDSLLWTEPGVTVTPHIATGLAPDVIENVLDRFLENYDRFVNRQQMIDVVDVARGY